MNVILGIDTSCYTTSAAAVCVDNGECVKYELIMLSPEKGEKGLRQSTALFFHIKNLPTVIQKLCGSEDFRIKGVCVSAKPRPMEGSYMSVFEAGVCTAKSIAAALNVPYYETTHQENHIMAASSGIFNREFYALHLSGGTTELLRVNPLQTGFDINIVSATSDISFGKLIDRIGVKLGFDFPAGKELELAANNGKPVFVPKLKLYDGAISLSGAEKQFSDACDIYTKEDIASSLFEYTGRLLAKWIGFNTKPGCDVLLAGGVASNKIIRNITEKSDELKDVKLHFAQPELCRDNAVGTALIGLRYYNAEHAIK